jgi:hypothetical protein
MEYDIAIAGASLIHRALVMVSGTGPMSQVATASLRVAAYE